MKTIITSIVALLMLVSCKKGEELTPTAQPNQLLTAYQWKAHLYEFTPDTTKNRNTYLIRITGTTSSGDSTIIVDPVKKFNIFGTIWRMAIIDSTQYITISSADTPIVDKDPAFYSGWKVRFKRLN